MSAREFVDSNIFVYMHDITAGSKRSSAIRLVDRLWTTGGGCASVQVLQEFFVVSSSKLTLPAEKCRAQVERLAVWRVHSPDSRDVVAAIEIHRRQRVSFWDAMIVRSAESLGCEVIWSEDLNDGQVIEGIEIRNPFMN
jgi:predicted nucleic acid-binding protein